MSSVDSAILLSPPTAYFSLPGGIDSAINAGGLGELDIR